MAKTQNLGIRGIKKTKDNFARLGIAIDSELVYPVLRKAVEPIAAQARTNIAPYSRTAAASIYIASKQPPSRPKKKTALVVMHKADTMRTWRAGPGNTSGRAKVPVGGMVSESLGTMVEGGTSRRYRTLPGITAHYGFRSAIEMRKHEVAANVISGMNQLITDEVAKMNTTPE